jgi:hypothetical protein
VEVDQSLNWKSVGGLTAHITALKEMVRRRKRRDSHRRWRESLVCGHVLVRDFSAR